jgi:hypothetical protein
MFYEYSLWAVTMAALMHNYSPSPAPFSVPAWLDASRNGRHTLLFAVLVPFSAIQP